MRYKRLGRTGLFVSELCLGTMTFGGKGFFEYMGGLGQEQADPLVKAALDAGVNFIDTANVYSQGLSEEITGRAIRNLGVSRHELVIATKVMGQMGDKPNDRGTSRVHILRQAQESLRRLGVDHIDLYQIHGFDPATGMEEQLAALDTLVQHGHVRYVGVSNWAAWQVEKALGIAERRNLARFETVQAYYSLAGRDLERELMPMVADAQMGLLVWSPLAGGFLSGKGDAEGRRATRAFPPVEHERGERVLAAMRPIAEAHGASMPQVALAWLLAMPQVTSVIMGAKRLDQLTDNLGAAGVKLSAEDLAALDEASKLPAEYPGWMQAQQGNGRRVGPNQPLDPA